MIDYAGIDFSLETSSICIVDVQGAIRRESKAESEPEAMSAAPIAPMARVLGVSKAGFHA